MVWINRLKLISQFVHLFLFSNIAQLDFTFLGKHFFLIIVTQIYSNNNGIIILFKFSLYLNNNSTVIWVSVGVPILTVIFRITKQSLINDNAHNVHSLNTNTSLANIN